MRKSDATREHTGANAFKGSPIELGFPGRHTIQVDYTMSSSAQKKKTVFRGVGRLWIGDRVLAESVRYRCTVGSAGMHDMILELFDDVHSPAITLGAGVMFELEDAQRVLGRIVGYDVLTRSCEFVWGEMVRDSNLPKA